MSCTSRCEPNPIAAPISVAGATSVVESPIVEIVGF
jgi:hypothetical protein